MVSPPEEGLLKEERDAKDKIIISNSSLRNILTPQPKNMNVQYKLMYGYKCCISAKIMHSSLLKWCVNHLKQLKYRSTNAQNRTSV